MTWKRLWILLTRRELKDDLARHRHAVDRLDEAVREVFRQ